jgi:dienelactone hydrolase
MRARTGLALGLAALLGTAGTAAAVPTTPHVRAAAPVVGVDAQCFAPQVRIDPMVDATGAPTNPDWIARDAVNQYCATLRLRDQAASPAFGVNNLALGGQLYAAQAQEQVADGPGHVHGGVTTLVPGSQAADPFRSIERWEALTGGKVTRITFPATDGAQLHGHLWMPPASRPRPKGGYPGVVITDGSVQAFEQLYYWAAEGLAQYGYQVLTFDVQGQGDSDLLPADCSPTSCQGVPYQQEYNFSQGAEDALSWFLSPKNPGRSSLDGQHVGLAGHSLGATAVSWVSQCDSRVKAVVAWDDLIVVDPKQCAQHVTVPKAYQSAVLHTPALTTTNDYEFNVQPATTVPNPHGDANAGGLAGDAGYQSLVKAGVDTQLVSLRNGTHLTYSYIPLVLPSNELSERFAFYYTLAWFDGYLRGAADPYTRQSAFDRLTNLGTYDDSADVNAKGAVSIGAGVWDPTAAADATNGNVPYLVKGISIPDSLSFYYFSGYRLTDPKTRRVVTCTDIVAHCPKVQPATP